MYTHNYVAAFMYTVMNFKILRLVLHNTLVMFPVLVMCTIMVK